MFRWWLAMLNLLGLISNLLQTYFPFISFVVKVRGHIDAGHGLNLANSSTSGKIGL